MARKTRASRRENSEPTLAEQIAALDKLRKLVRQIEADRADRDPGRRAGATRKSKPDLSNVA
jgi:hypothetical protein